MTDPAGMDAVQERLEAAGVDHREALRLALETSDRLERGEDPDEVADAILTRRRASEKRAGDPAYGAL